MKAIYNYARVSSDKQAKGTGIETQTQRKTLESLSSLYNLPIAENVYVDIGTSGFKGHHLDQQFGEVLAAIDSGVISAGSILVVFNLDRLSRQNVNIAMQQFLNIINRGVRVYTAADNKLFDAESKNLTSDLIISLITMQRAYEESLTKQKRSIAYVESTIREWEQNGRRLKQSKRPFWVGQDYKFNEYEAAARYIIKARLEGRLSMQAISEYLTQHYPRTNKKGDNQWGMSAVSKFCKNTDTLIGDRVINYTNAEGDQVTKRLVGYYPALCDYDTAHLIKSNNKSVSTGKRLDTVCLLTKANILYCGNCGLHMYKHTTVDGWRYRCASTHSYTCVDPCANRMHQPDVVDLVVLLLLNNALKPHSSSGGDGDKQQLQARLQAEKDAVADVMQRYKKSGSSALLDLIEHHEAAISELESKLHSVSNSSVDESLKVAGHYYHAGVLQDYSHKDRMDCRAAIIKSVERIELSDNGFDKATNPFNAGVISVKVRGRDTVTVEFFTEHWHTLPANPSIADIYRCCDPLVRLVDEEKHSEDTKLLVGFLREEIAAAGAWWKLYPHRGHNRNPQARELVKKLSKHRKVLPSGWERIGDGSYIVREIEQE